MALRLTTLLLATSALAFALGVWVHRTGAIQSAVSPLISRTPGEPSAYAIVRQALFEEYPATGNVVMVGDSLTEWMDWNAALAAPGRTIVSRAIGGETVGGALIRVPSIVATGAKTAVIMLGINDVIPRIPMGKIAADYGNLVDRLRQAGMKVIVFPCVTARTEVSTPTAELNQRLEAICTKDRCTFVPLPGLIDNGVLRPELAIDGVHLNADGYRVWVTAIRAALS